jgi:ABC-type branched-subunit amino acid transport system ATPase component
MTTLQTHGLTKSFGGVLAVDDVSVAIEPGKINGLIGPNGSGKTTFFNLVTGMIRADAGQVVINGLDTTGWAPHRVAHAGVGRTFQLCRILPRLSVMENMLVALRRPRLRELLGGLTSPADVDKARSWLGRVGLDHLERSEARDISYGQQKLLELAAILMAEPDLIMLDEPAGGVNPALIDRIATLIRDLNAEGRTFLVVEHNMDLVMNVCDHIVVFDRGRPIADGSPDDVRANERVLEAYLGV